MSGEKLQDDSKTRPALEWMAKTLEWGVHVRPDKGGVTLGALNVGIYGEIPDEWHDMTRMPRGAYPLSGVPAIGGYTQRRKAELWADNAADLYEEAISRRWIPARDVPWDEAMPLPEDVELAMAQVCTELSQEASIETEVLSGWLQELSFGYHEVKLFLATEVYDAARHFELFRKRALINGAGLRLESPGQVNRLLLESRAGWTETSVLLHLLRGCFTQTVYRYCAAYAPTNADSFMFHMAMQDKARHLAYGMQHLRYAVAHRPDFGEQVQRFMSGAELSVVKDDEDPVMWEALAIVFGGGVRQMDAGMRVVSRLRHEYVRTYLNRLKWAGIDRHARVLPVFARVLEPGVPAA